MNEEGDLVAEEVSEHLLQNVEAIADLHARAEERVDRHQRAIEVITAKVGRPAFLYTALGAIALWIAGNLVAPLMGLPQLDPPPFVWLQGAVGSLALTLANMILITQYRQVKRAEQRAHLELQFNMMAERKITKLISLVEELRRDLPNVRDRHDAEAEAMTKPADPESVVHALEKKLDDDR